MEIKMYCDNCEADVFAILYKPREDWEAECTQCYCMIQITDDMLPEIYEQADREGY